MHLIGWAVTETMVMVSNNSSVQDKLSIAERVVPWILPVVLVIFVVGALLASLSRAKSWASPDSDSDPPKKPKPKGSG